jgi:hypothetical protein
MLLRDALGSIKARGLSMKLNRAAGIAAMAFLAMPIAVASAQCAIDVHALMPVAGVGRGVKAVASFDDGSGAALYVGGSFVTAGDIDASHIAKWDGSSWSAVGAGVDADILAMTVYDDGSGPALFVAGDFSIAGGEPSNQIARWDGHHWSNLGPGTGGVEGGRINALCVFDDDGPGPRPPGLYAGGEFTSAGGVPANRIARWDGVSWTPLAEGLGGEVPRAYALAVFDEDADGPELPKLFVGGSFGSAGGQPISYLARWDGSEWSQVGTGVVGWIQALAVLDRGDGGHLIAGGFLTHAGDAVVSSVAQWDGESWSGLSHGLYAWVNCMTTLDIDGPGPGLPAVYMGGYITVASGAYVNNLARWDGERFSTVNGGVDGWVGAVGVHDDGSGAALVVGGSFVTVGVNTAAANVAKWRGAWSPLGSGLSTGASKMVVFDDGAGPALFAAGNVSYPNGWSSIGVVRWDGHAWWDVGLPTNGRFWGVTALAVLPDLDATPTLFAAGEFVFADGRHEWLVAKLNDHHWIPLGTQRFWEVEDLAVLDDGDGPQLYAAGAFTRIDTADVLRVARWNGVEWSPVGEGFNDAVHALRIFDDGQGPALYAAGDFTMSGDNEVRHVARLHAGAWTQVGAGCPYKVTDLAAFPFPDGSPRLLAAQVFSLAVPQWDGAAWTDFSRPGFGVTSFLTHDPDANGPAPLDLYAISGGSNNEILKWSGSAWVPLVQVPPDLDHRINCFTVFDIDGPGAAPSSLMVGGGFEHIEGLPTAGIAAVSFEGMPPVLQDLPSALVVPPGSDFQLTIEHSEEPNVAYQWRRNGEPTHAYTRTLRFAYAELEDSGIYDVVVSTPCGSVTSTPVDIWVGCRADWDRSSEVDFLDFSAFLDAFFNADADFNDDGLTDSRDFFDFLASYFNGC